MTISNVCFLALSGRCTVTSLTAAPSHNRTFAYLTERLAGYDVTVTRLAQGVPVGGKLDYLN